MQSLRRYSNDKPVSPLSSEFGTFVKVKDAQNFIEIITSRRVVTLPNVVNTILIIACEYFWRRRNRFRAKWLCESKLHKE